MDYLNLEKVIFGESYINFGEGYIWRRLYHTLSTCMPNPFACNLWQINIFKQMEYRDPEKTSHRTSICIPEWMQCRRPNAVIATIAP